MAPQPIDDDRCLSTSTLIGRRDYGVKIARKYFDVRTAPDTGILFNSSYPLLQMVYAIGDVTELPHTEGYTYIPGTSYVTGYQVTYTLEHNLGYVPLILNLSEATGTTSASEALYGDWEGFSCDLFGVTRKRAYFRVWVESDSPTSAQIAKIPQYAKQFVRMLITQIGIRHDVEYPYTFAPQEISANEIPTDYGAKTFLNGADESTTDPYNIGLNLNLFPQLVLAVKTEETISDKWAELGYDNRATLYQVPDDIDYDPMFLCFRSTEKDDYGDDIFVPDTFAAQSPNGYRFIESTRRIYQSAIYEDPVTGDTSTAKISMVVLRLPLLAAQMQEITV